VEILKEEDAGFPGRKVWSEHWIGSGTLYDWNAK
jgi:hypothetical protein